ncbi:hypothetical protein AB1K91_15010 [Terribacillus sp. 179-K 1B1 HS]|uniref:hypothetical protein n=1 Tax=Terribacillus sp. 179-K 1B1 HS TaxID=3142388 RepID=UPI0039A2FA24
MQSKKWKKIITLCNEKDIKWDENGLYFSIILHKVNSPKHLFTEEEIEKELKEGDDSKDVLVIDADGYAQFFSLLWKNLVTFPEYSIQARTEKKRNWGF